MGDRPRSKYLINERTLIVLPSVAKAIGLNEAIIAQQVHYWLDHSTNERGGLLWVYKTYEEWSAEFPFWSISTIKRTIYKLEEKNILKSTDKFNRDATDRTKWYTLNYEALDRACQNDTVERIKLEHSRACQNDTLLHYTNNTHRVLPEERPNIFTVYEQNIGMLTPIIADKLKDIEGDYPDDWFEEAVEIAVENNARKLNYVMAIMERWGTQGKDNGRGKGRKTPYHDEESIVPSIDDDPFAAVSEAAK